MEYVSTRCKQKENELDSQLVHIENGLSPDVLQSIKSVLSKPSDIYKLFFLFTKKLNKLFSISQSALILHSSQENKLKVIAMKGEKGARKGLALTLPEKDSLLYKISKDNQIYIQHHLENFESNFIEEKVLINEAAQSLVILPISQNGTKFGLVCLSSPNKNAFLPFENGVMDEVVETLTNNLIKRMPLTEI